MNEEYIYTKINEEKMEEQTNKKDELFNFVGYYKGKDFKKKGTKNGKDWKNYTARFKDSMNIQSQYDVKFSVFDSCKGFGLLNDSSAEDNILLKICYKYSPFINAQGQAGKSKSIVLVALATNKDVEYYKRDYEKKKAEKQEANREAPKGATVSSTDIPEELKPVLEYYLNNDCKPEDILEFKGVKTIYAIVLKGWI